MAFVVVYDASVPYGNTLRDLLIRIAQTGRATPGVPSFSVSLGQDGRRLDPPAVTRPDESRQMPPTRVHADGVGQAAVRAARRRGRCRR
jgi:hypothetical protein